MRRTRTALAVAMLLSATACGDEGAQEPQAADTTAAVLNTAAPVETTPPSTTTTTIAPVTAGEFGERIPLQVVNEAGRPGQLFDATAVAVSDGGVIAVASDDGALSTFDAEGTSLTTNGAAHDGAAIVGLGFVDERLFTVAEDGTVLSWAEPGVDLAEASASRSLDMGAIATAAMGNGWLAVGAVDAGIALYPTTGDGEVGDAVWSKQLTTRATALAVAPGASMAAAAPAVAVVTNAGEVVVYEESGEPVGLARPAGSASSIAFVDDGQAVLVAGDTLPFVVDVDTAERRELTSDVTPSGEAITAVAGWSGEGGTSSRIATAGTDAPAGSSGTTVAGGGPVVAVRLSSTGAPEVGLPTRGFQSAVRHLAFLPDGGGLVIADGDHVVLQLIEG